jgi:hypothetical protein
MMTQKNTPRPAKGRRTTDEHLKDEVYRHMFRLEANRRGADLDLAVALLRAWLASDAERGASAVHEWLKKICPICVSMIEASRHTPAAGGQCIQ